MHLQRQSLVTELTELLRAENLYLMKGQRRGEGWIQH